jgi:hypothetical protein
VVAFREESSPLCDLGGRRRGQRHDEGGEKRGGGVHGKIKGDYKYHVLVDSQPGGLIAVRRITTKRRSNRIVDVGIHARERGTTNHSNDAEIQRDEIISRDCNLPVRAKNKF